MNFGGIQRLTYPSPDHKLVHAHLCGDSRAFALLINAHRDLLWRIVRNACPDEALAHDCLHEGLSRALHSLSTFRGDANVTTWLSRIVFNSTMDFHRGRFGRTPTLPSLSDDSREPQVDSPIPPRDVALRVTLDRALAQLPTSQRDALVQVDLMGYSLNELAEMLGSSAGTIKSRRHRARVFLQEYLSDADA